MRINFILVLLTVLNLTTSVHAKEVVVTIKSATVPPFTSDTYLIGDDAFEVDINIGNCTYNDIKMGYNCSEYLDLPSITVPGNDTNKVVTTFINETYSFDTDDLSESEKKEGPSIYLIELGLPVQLLGMDGGKKCLHQIIYDQPTTSCGDISVGVEGFYLNINLRTK